MKIKDCWFYLEPYVYTTVKQGRALLYNTLDAMHMEVDNPELVALVEELLDKDSLGVIRLNADKLSSKPIADFVVELRDKFMGDLIPVDSTHEKPMQLIPMLNLQNEIDRLHRINENAIGQNVLDYLLELTLYINNTCNKRCSHCSSYAKQSRCCSPDTTDSVGEELPLAAIQSLLSQCAGRKINVAGGNILQYSRWNELLDMLKPLGYAVNLWIHYLNVAEVVELPSTTGMSIFVSFPHNDTLLKQCVERTAQRPATTYYFLITSEQEYNKAEALAAEYGLTGYSVAPIYTEENKAFFEEYVYADYDDIFSSPSSMKRIFSRQVANPKFFGRLYVLPNQDVKGSLNTEVLGNLQEESLLNIINRELVEGSAWRYIRTQAPCTDCLYQYLCPAPSGYEQVMQQPAMCKLHVEEKFIV